MQSDWPYMHSYQSYAYFKSPLHHAPDHSAIFLTVLAGRTVKNSLSPRGPGFDSRRRQQKGHRSIESDYEIYILNS